MKKQSTTTEWIIVGVAALVLVGIVTGGALMLWSDETSTQAEHEPAPSTPADHEQFTTNIPSPSTPEQAQEQPTDTPTPVPTIHSEPRTEAPTAPSDRAAQVGEAVVLNDQVRWLVIEFRHEGQQVALTVETENLTDQTASLELPVFEDWSGQQFDPDNTEASCTPGAEVRPGEVRQCSWSYQVDADSERMMLLVKNYADPFGAEQFVRLGWQ
jgi:hypothetical protein